jgi:NAD(P)-dependent dehydrogenase (short-subunit alcohol dehydrogenase family)
MIDPNDLLWTKRSWSGSSAYAESKLCDVLLAFAVARRWKEVKSNALEPGWVATKMGGLPPRTIFTRDVSPRLGSPRARTSWRDRRGVISIINALMRRTQSRRTLGLRKICSPSGPHLRHTRE